MTLRTPLAAAALLLAATAQAQTRQWPFEVRLDDTPIGQHRFELTGSPADGTLKSEAAFTVRLLGIPVYRYRHSATERWRDGCLDAMQAGTDDNGDKSQVDARKDGGALRIDGGSGGKAESATGCVMSFAYWNPAIRQQPRLLNAQTGALEPVKIERAGTGTVEVRGQAVPAVRWRISGPKQPIELWESAADGAWIGLDSTVSGGKRLSYRLK
ncbi:DUF6134 family protein [Aquabacterium sp. J223]|uniref:DUF6134 family protein n=1 Tax=Aquabacterium sp. J223 TaxID=2898431 RepID=UPI0021ADB7E3|nr:DUF6134 family protein [Aquabacterium sp. J223]UUX94400.1 DUF6134 family protein [Aquabacterium sp. J223]